MSWSVGLGMESPLGFLEEVWEDDLGEHLGVLHLAGSWEKEQAEGAEGPEVVYPDDRCPHLALGSC